jgi:hydrogenase expression/formation protein HypE
VANEGRFVAFVARDDADRALAILHGHRLGEGAVRIGDVGAAGSEVVMTGSLGTSRVVDLPSGEQLPRIC